MTTTTASLNITEELPSSSSLTSDYGTCGNRCCPGSGTLSENRNQQQSATDAVYAQSRKSRVWRKPWMVALVLFFVFYILWAYGVVVKRYWISENFTKALPGLGTSIYRKHTMRLHMTFGALAILCSPIQMLTPFTSGWKKIGESSTRNWYRQLHRYSGRVYVMCAIMSFFFGQWFIILKQFVLVGGYNMGVSFSFAGFFIAYFAYMTWKTAPRKEKNSSYTIEDHRNYAIRSFSQIIAPILYRYWYALMMILKLYRTPYLNDGDDRDGKLVCDNRNVCSDYERPFDAIYSWLYWLSAWAVAEIVIVCLPKHQERRTTVVSTQPLLEARHLTTDDTSLADTDESNSESYNIQEENPVARGSANDENNKPIAWVLNLIGCVLVTLTATVTGFIIMQIFK